MEEQKTGCLVCGAPLEYLQSQIEMECTYCHKKFMSNARCVNGHFICDSCHEQMCRLPRYLTKPRQRRSEWDMAGSDGISRVSAVFRGKSLLTNKMRII